MVVAQVFQCGSREMGASPIIITQHDMSTLEWYSMRDQKLQLTPGDQASPWNMAAIVLARLTDIDEGELGAALP
jgi:hypothetical protein